MSDTALTYEDFLAHRAIDDPTLWEDETESYEDVLARYFAGQET